MWRTRGLGGNRNYEDETTQEKITSDPLWRKLDAVRDGRVYEVSDDLWMLGIGPTAAVGVVDDLDRHLAAGRS